MRLFGKRDGWSSFRYLNYCQFVGAMNDNTFKLLLAFCFIQLQGAQSSNKILSIAGAIYVLPFILLSTTAGILADKYSKRSIIVFTRLAEIIVILFGVLSFFAQSEFFSFLSLFLMATHSAIFGPCKYGVVPEIVPKEEISQANGMLTSSSYVAIIFGTFLASFLADVTNRNFVVSLAICSLFSISSLLVSVKIQHTPPAGSTKKVTPNLIAEMRNNLRIISREPSLLSAVLGSAFFLFIGSYVQLNMIPYAMNVLHLTDVQGGYMFLLTAFGIGIGSLLAGKLSGKSVEFGLVPLGGIGMGISSLLLDYYSGSLSTVLLLIFCVGLFGGLYLVPLDSYIQVASPRTRRGQIVATGNVLGFAGVLLSALSMYVLSEVMGVRPDTGFTIIGITTLIIAAFIFFSMSGYVIRFFCLLSNYFFFRVDLKGKMLIPLDKPSIFIVPHSFWPWVMVLLASQRLRMRVYTVAPQSTPPFPASLLRRLISIQEIHDIQEIMPEGEYAENIRHAVARGTSIAIFCSQRTIAEQTQLLRNAWSQEFTLRFFTLATSEKIPSQPIRSACIEEVELD